MKNLIYEVLVLGMGNLLMTDDGLGVYAVDILKREKWPPGIGILDVGTSLICYWKELSQSRKVIAIDAVRAGGKPGQLYRLQPKDWAVEAQLQDAHGYSLLEVVEMARELTGFPSELIIYGLEPLDCGFGTRLSPVVAKMLPKLIWKVKKEVSSLSKIGMPEKQ